MNRGEGYGMGLMFENGGYVTFIHTTLVRPITKKNYIFPSPLILCRGLCTSAALSCLLGWPSAPQSNLARSRSIKSRDQQRSISITRSAKVTQGQQRSYKVRKGNQRSAEVTKGH